MPISKSILQTIILTAAAGVLGAWYVIDNQASRDFPRIQDVEMQIRSLEADIASLDQRPELPTHVTSWQLVESIAEQSGVELTAMTNGEATHITMDQLPGGSPWYGKLVGTTTNVAMAAKRLQKQLPVIFGQGEFGNKQMALSFALLGTTGNP